MKRKRPLWFRLLGRAFDIGRWMVFTMQRPIWPGIGAAAYAILLMIILFISAALLYANLGDYRENQKVRHDNILNGDD